MDLAVGPRLRRRRRIRADVTRIAVRQVEGEEMRFLLDPADDDHHLAEVRLRVPGRMVKRHEHLAAAPLMLAQVCLHDGVAAGEPVLVTKPVEDPLGRVPLLARGSASSRSQASMISVNPSSFGRLIGAVLR